MNIVSMRVHTSLANSARSKEGTKEDSKPEASNLKVCSVVGRLSRLSGCHVDGPASLHHTSALLAAFEEMPPAKQRCTGHTLLMVMTGKLVPWDR